MTLIAIFIAIPLFPDDIKNNNPSSKGQKQTNENSINLSKKTISSASDQEFIENSSNHAMTDRVLAARNNQANNKNIFSQIDKSKSDPAYAYQLWKLFSKCKQIDEPNKKLLQSNKGNSAEHTDYCYQFDLNENVDINEFLYLAAKGGIPQAAVEYFNTAFMNFDDSHQNSKKSTQFADAIEAMQFLNNAADGGLPDAMIMISGIYQTGSLVEKDYEKAYSYEYAANRSGIFSNRDKILDIISTHLTADQLRSASKKGEEIFRNCCME